MKKSSLEGSWIQIACNSDGVSNPEEEYGTVPIVTFRENTFSVRSASGSIVIEGVFEIDCSVSPMHINWTDTFGRDAGKTFLSIGKIENGILEFSAANQGMKRPSDFLPMEGHTIRKFKKIQ